MIYLRNKKVSCFMLCVAFVYFLADFFALLKRTFLTLETVKNLINKASDICSSFSFHHYTLSFLFSFFFSLSLSIYPLGLRTITSHEHI